MINDVLPQVQAEQETKSFIMEHSFETTFERHQAEDVKLPARLYSIETYVCLGFTHEMVEKLSEKLLMS